MARIDPLRGFRFLLEIDDITSGGFARVKGDPEWGGRPTSVNRQGIWDVPAAGEEHTRGPLAVAISGVRLGERVRPIGVDDKCWREGGAA